MLVCSGRTLILHEIRYAELRLSHYHFYHIGGRTAIFFQMQGLARENSQETGMYILRVAIWMTNTKATIKPLICTEREGKRDP